MLKIGLFGAGGHSKVIYECIKSTTKCVIDIFDDKKKYIKIGEKKLKIRGNFKKLVKDQKLYDNLFISIGDNKVRKKYFKKIEKIKKKNISFIHLNSIISPSVKIKEGTVIMANSVIQSDSSIGKNCIINTSVSIDHDCRVMNHTHICPGVNIAGGVTIGENCWIGIGTKIIENIKIGNNVLIGAGSVVTKNIKSNSFVMGVPAKNAK
jgi:sugar O-acyltransferase (sialic acid O-acetyltransferase NeuD family)